MGGDLLTLSDNKKNLVNKFAEHHVVSEVRGLWRYDFERIVDNAVNLED